MVQSFLTAAALYATGYYGFAAPSPSLYIRTGFRLVFVIAALWMVTICIVAGDSPKGGI